MKKLLSSLSAFVVALGLVEACATDNGSAVYGDQFGPPPGGNGIEAGTDATPVPSGDGAAEDASTDAPADGQPPTCSAGTVAVLAGSDAALSYAISDKGAAFKGGAVTGGSSVGQPELVAFGTGFLGLTRGAGDKLLSTVSQNGA